MQSKRSGETYRNFANGMIYNAAGAVEAMRLGNGRWENTVFNSRLQPTKIGLGNGVNSQDLLKLEYSYGTTANNGNVVSQTITVPGVAEPFVQTYTYDELNRLTNAEEIKNSVQQWEQTFTYDRFGNRNFNEAETTTLPKNCGTTPNFTVCTADKKIVNPSVNTANNRLSTSDDYAFDAAGNLIVDAEGKQFTYDAENKQIQAKNSGNDVLGTYFFDGDGKRVKKVVPGTDEVTIFVYDASGKLIQEHSTIVQPTQDAKTQYLTNDHLGTPRINTDSTGQVVSRSDYMPFGEEIVGLGGRSSGQGYVVDDVRQGFTGYENDDETGFDYAQARYYAKGFGRFMSADPVLLSKHHLANPQRWNGYIYVLNAPTVATDPDGRKPKIVIDVFLTYDSADAKSWKAVQRYAKKHNATINIYTKEAGTATLDQFKKSLGTKNTTVIVVGHSYVPPADHEAAENGTGTVAGKGVGIEFAGGGLASPTAASKGFMQGSPTLEGVEAKAKNLVVLTCDFGDTFAPVGSSNKTNFLWAAGGNDGLTTTLGTVAKVGRKMAEVFARGGSAREAQGAGSAILGLAPGNDGEFMVREVLQPVSNEEE